MVRLGIAAQAACFSLLSTGIALFALGSVQAQTQSSSVVLDRIDVEAARGGAARPSGASQPGEGGQDESAYGPVQGYAATRSATGTKTDTPLGETPQSVTVVTADEIKDQGVTTIQESLRYVPGAYADAYGPDSRGDYPRVRGSDPNIFLDGTQAVNAWSFNEWRPDPYTLSRVEVLRGPSSVLYGATSTAGIINMVSKLPQAESHREIGVQYGSFNRKQVQADLTGKLTADGEWLYRLIGVFRDSGYQTDFVPNDRILIQPAVTWKPSKATSWTLMGFYQKDDTGSSTAFLPHEGTLYPGPNGFVPVNRFLGEPGFDKYRTTTGSASSLFEHSFSETFKIRQNTRYLHTDGIYHTMYASVFYNALDSSIYPFLDPARRTIGRQIWMAEAVRDNLTSDTHAELKFASGPVSHKLLFGFDYRLFLDSGRWGGGYDGTPFDLYAPVYTGATAVDMYPYAGTRQRQAGMYIQDQMRLGQWIAVIGARHDRLKSRIEGEPVQTDGATSSRIGLMYELPGGLTPYVSWAQSFDPVFGATTCVGGMCQPKRGELKEVGFKYTPWKGLAVNAALYDITEKNRLASDPAGSSLSIQTGEVRIRGGEAEVIGSLTRDLDIIGAYAYTDARIVQGDYVGARVESVPLHQASLWAKYKFPLFGVPGFSIGGGARYVGESFSTGEYWNTSTASTTVTIATPSYMLYDAMFGYENDTWRFQINAMNLADKRHVTTCLARGDCFYGQSRTIVTSLTYKF